MHRLLLSCLVLLALALAACEGCRAPSTRAPAGSDGGGEPSARLYLVSDLAGALEPCGCVKDQLGGMDHFGAFVAADKPKPLGHAVLGAGPLFFLDMELSADKKSQETAKAETIAGALKTLGLLAFAPGRNDWADGADELGKLAAASGASMLAANLSGAPPAAKWIVKDVGGVKVGVVGVAAPDKAKVPLEGVTSSTPAQAVKAGIAALKGEGAQVVVALAAVGRGEAKRIADDNPELLAVVVGSTGGGGEANTEAPPAERVGDVLVVETANHLQTVSVLDLYLRDPPKGQLVKLTDATGIERVRKRDELTSRIDELRKKIAIWENDTNGHFSKADIDARKADVAKLEAERAGLDKTPAPVSGSFYRYTRREMRDDLGKDTAVGAQMLAYYKKVNDENKAAFADRKPKPPPKGQPSYVGIDACTNCHEDARAVWDKTRHAQAYKTLADAYKEYNLDCVSCHVTGYDRPGGSTVTHVAELKDVQCEVCHGPGSLHAGAKDPEKVAMPVPKPNGDTCLACHHPPHVHAFDPAEKMPKILGRGHGKASP